MNLRRDLKIGKLRTAGVVDKKKKMKRQSNFAASVMLPCWELHGGAVVGAA